MYHDADSLLDVADGVVEQRVVGINRSVAAAAQPFAGDALNLERGLQGAPKVQVVFNEE